MAVIQCDICGGSLTMDTSGEFATCDSCGMRHTKDRVKAMAQEVTGTVEVSNIASLESLMKRGNLALEDSAWKQADEYFDKVLDIDPEYAPAYVGKLCAELLVRSEDKLSEAKIANSKIEAIKLYREKTGVGLKEAKDYIENLGDNFLESSGSLANYGNFQKAVRFGSAELQIRLKGYDEKISNRIAEGKRQEEGEKRLEEERIENKKKQVIESILPYKTLIATKTEEAKKKDIELRKKYEEDKKKWSEDVNRRQEQSNVWKSQKLCPHCGGKVGLFNKKCKVCNKEASNPVELPSPPNEPDYNVPKLNTSIILQSIHISFGGYDWQLLDIKGNKALLWSEKNIEECSYISNNQKDGKTAEKVSWEDCYLNHYLQNDFLRRFSAVEKDMISDISLLSGDEVIKYFGVAGNFKTNYDYVPLKYRAGEKEGGWWLSKLPSSKYSINFTKKIWPSGNNFGRIVAICSDNKISLETICMKNTSGTWGGGLDINTRVREFGVRPALWIKLE